jgi:hypothetical protein
MTTSQTEVLSPPHSIESADEQPSRALEQSELNDCDDQDDENCNIEIP